MSGFSYKPGGAVLKSYMRSNAFFRGIRGPVGSGKSAGSLIELYRRANEQKPEPDGKRYTRWIVVRNTNPQLKTTTIKTWLDWFPEEVFGKFNWSPPYTHHIKIDDIDAEFIFLSMDREEDVRKVLSLEYTGAFANEARELPKSVIDAMTMRAGRYPSLKNGIGPTWCGVVADTNAPDDDHWWPIVAGDVPPPDSLSEEERLMLIKPDDWEFFDQPPGMLEILDDKGGVIGYKENPDAENIKNLRKDYYPSIIAGKRKSWIDVYVLNRYGNTGEGRSVYPMFRKETHVAKEPLKCVEGIEVIVGMDFGRTPAAAFGQKLPGGQWRIFHEIVAEGMGAGRFATLLKLELSQYVHPTCKIRLYGDPSGEYGSDHDEQTYFQILRGNGVHALPATTNNDPTIRIESVERQLTTMVDGRPGFLISPSCKILIKGFTGGYCYARVLSRGAESFEDKPTKNRYSHPHDALQYLFMGAGEGYEILKNREKTKVGNARGSTNLWDRLKKSKGKSRSRKTRMRI